MVAIKAGIITPTTKAELEKAEAEQKNAEAALKANAGVSEILTTFLPKAADRYRGLISGLGQALSTDVVESLRG